MIGKKIQEEDAALVQDIAIKMLDLTNGIEKTELALLASVAFLKTFIDTKYINRDEVYDVIYACLQEAAADFVETETSENQTIN